MMTTRPGEDALAGEDTFVFDSHVHVGRWRIADFGGHGTTLAETAGILAAAGIRGALVMPTDSGDNAGLLAELDAFDGPVRFAAAAWAVPDDQALAALVDTHDFRAIKIHPSFCRVPVTDAAWAPSLEVARSRRLPVVVHCGRWQEMAGYGLLLKAAETWPDVDFVMAHMGGDSPSLVLGAARETVGRGFENVYFGTESIREYWILAEAIGIVGADRVLFGSDHNLNPPAAFRAVIDAIGLSAADRRLVLGENAVRLFGLSHD
jgi:predicted TIM-barrel fold metal-dependent hydrolase